MNLAGQRIAEFAGWLDASSSSRLSPCAAARYAAPRRRFGFRPEPVKRWDDYVARGRFGELLPTDFDKPFDEPFDPQALCLLISFEQADGVQLGETADLGLPASQARAFHRLLQLVHRCQDRVDAAKAGPKRYKADAFPPLALISLDDAHMTPRQACEIAGASSLDPDVPKIVAVTFKLATKERAIIRTYLPLLA